MKLSRGSKAQLADRLYQENRLIKELSSIAVDTIENMDEEIELKDKKIDILEKELKDINQYDIEKINSLFIKNPIIRYNNKERAKRRLAKTINMIK